MKKTNILAALLLMVAGVQTASAQKVTLHKAGGEAVEFNISRIDSIAIVGRYDTDTKEYVDLGLPSGTLWATCNIGASKPEEYGDLFAWGETEPKEIYRWDNYKHGTGPLRLTKYSRKTDNKLELDPEDDAATVNWGSEWQMPSEIQMEELISSDYTTSTIETRNGIKGRLITSKFNGNSIFLPAAGFFAYDPALAGEMGYYWSLTLDEYVSEEAICICAGVSWDGLWITSDNREIGRSVRPIRRKQ